MPNIEPFPFERLKTYSSSRAAMLSSVARLLPSRGEASPFAEALSRVFSQTLKEKIEVAFSSLVESNARDFTAAMGDKCVCFAVTLTPHPKNFMIELDFTLARAIIDKMLGGTGDAEANSAFTSLDQGVLQFFCARALKECRPLTGKMGLTLRQVMTEARLASPTFPPEEEFFIITYGVRYRQGEGYFRLCFPHSLLELVWKDPEVFPPREIGALPSWKAILWAELGRVSLTADDLSRLEEGDVLFFDEVYPTFDQGRLQGDCYLRLGDGEKGILSTIEEVAGGWKIKLREIVHG